MEANRECVSKMPEKRHKSLILNFFNWRMGMLQITDKILSVEKMWQKLSGACLVSLKYSGRIKDVLFSKFSGNIKYPALLLWSPRYLVSDLFFHSQLEVGSGRWLHCWGDLVMWTIPVLQRNSSKINTSKELHAVLMWHILCILLFLKYFETSKLKHNMLFKVCYELASHH